MGRFTARNGSKDAECVIISFHLGSDPGSVLYDCVASGMFFYLREAQSPHLEDGANNDICYMGWL